MQYSFHKNSKSVTNVTFLFLEIYYFNKKKEFPMQSIKTKYTLLRIIFLILFVVLFLVKKIQLWLLVYGIGILLSFFYGRIYCGYVCPMNSSMHVVVKLAKKLKLQENQFPLF